MWSSGPSTQCISKLHPIKVSCICEHTCLASSLAHGNSGGSDLVRHYVTSCTVKKAMCAAVQERSGILQRSSRLYEPRIPWTCMQWLCIGRLSTCDGSMLSSPDLYTAAHCMHCMPRAGQLNTPIYVQPSTYLQTADAPRWQQHCNSNSSRWIFISQKGVKRQRPIALDAKDSARGATPPLTTRGSVQHPSLAICAQAGQATRAHKKRRCECALMAPDRMTTACWYTTSQRSPDLCSVQLA